MLYTYYKHITVLLPSTISTVLFPSSLSKLPLHTFLIRSTYSHLPTFITHHLLLSQHLSHLHHYPSSFKNISESSVGFLFITIPSFIPHFSCFISTFNKRHTGIASVYMWPSLPHSFNHITIVIFFLLSLFSYFRLHFSRFNIQSQRHPLTFIFLDRLAPDTLQWPTAPRNSPHFDQRFLHFTSFSSIGLNTYLEPGIDQLHYPLISPISKLKTI
jgi:hypothetical protein